MVQLFNAVQQSQLVNSAAIEKSKAERGSGRPSLSSVTLEQKGKGKPKVKDKDNVLGRGKGALSHLATDVLY